MTKDKLQNKIKKILFWGVGGDLLVLLMAHMIIQMISFIAFPICAPASLLCIVNLLAIEMVKVHLQIAASSVGFSSLLHPHSSTYLHSTNNLQHIR